MVEMCLVARDDVNTETQCVRKSISGTALLNGFWTTRLSKQFDGTAHARRPASPLGMLTSAVSEAPMWPSWWARRGRCRRQRAWWRWW